MEKIASAIQRVEARPVRGRFGHRLARANCASRHGGLMADRIVGFMARRLWMVGLGALVSACTHPVAPAGAGGGDASGGNTGGAATGGSVGSGGSATGGTPGSAGGTSGTGGRETSGGGGSGGVTSTGGAGGRSAASGGAGATASGGAGGSQSSGPFPGQACLSRADGLVAQMTASEKYGQMLQMERLGLTAQNVTSYALGSVFSQGGSAPTDNSPAGWADMTDSYRQGALASRLKIPSIYGADEVHGVGTVPGATVFPHNIGLGATRDVALVEQLGRLAADEARGCGVDFFFSPVVAVARDERWGRTYEAYGETTDLANTMGAAMTRGIQLSATGAFSGIVANAKHYLGDGGTANGVTGGNVTGDETALRTI